MTRLNALRLPLLGLAGMCAALATPMAASPARFAWFDYRGIEGASAGPGKYRNPILAGFYSDPSVLRVGTDYYLVTSTFSWFPGIPVFHSRDLVHWRQIGNAIDRPGMLDFSRLGFLFGNEVVQAEYQQRVCVGQHTFINRKLIACLIDTLKNGDGVSGRLTHNLLE